MEAQELDLGGVEGVWLPREMADKVLSDAELVPKLESKISHLESALIIRSDRMENFRLGMRLAETSRDEAIKALQSSELQLEYTKTKMNSWYRSPFLWLGVGLIVGVAAETSIVLAINR